MSYIRQYKPKAIKGSTVTVERFSSAEEIVRVSDSRNLRDCYAHRNPRAGFDSWHGVDSWEEATNLLTYGYKPFVSEMQSKIDFTARGDGVKTSFRNEVVGFAPVVPLALIGVPNCMVNTYKQPIKNKVVDIFFDKVAVASHSSRDIENACSKFMSALINVEMQGYRVNLYITEAHSARPNVDMMCLKVKDANTPLDLQRISFPLAHPAFFRAIGFDWFMRCPSAKVTRSGLGTAMDREYSKDEIVKTYEEIFGGKCIVFEMEDIINRNEQSIVDSITFANNRYA